MSGRRRVVGTAALAAFVAVVVTLTGFEASSHRHAPKLDGWHKAGSQGDTDHDEELIGCSFCRLAHETSSAPIVPGQAALPLQVVSPHLAFRSVLTALAVAREHSPRAPPCFACC